MHQIPKEIEEKAMEILNKMIDKGAWRDALCVNDFPHTKKLITQALMERDAEAERNMKKVQDAYVKELDRLKGLLREAEKALQKADDIINEGERVTHE